MTHRHADPPSDGKDLIDRFVDWVDADPGRRNMLFAWTTVGILLIAAFIFKEPIKAYMGL